MSHCQQKRRRELESECVSLNKKDKRSRSHLKKRLQTPSSDSEALFKPSTKRSSSVHSISRVLRSPPRQAPCSSKSVSGLPISFSGSITSLTEKEGDKSGTDSDEHYPHHLPTMWGA